MTSYTIYSWNVNGIRAAGRKGMDEWLASVDADILAVQEVRALRDQIPNALRNLDYHIDIHVAEKLGYSGVATFSTQKPTEVTSSMGQQEFDDEGRLLMTRYSDFVLFNVYFPNGKKNAERLDYKMRFYDKFHEICSELLSNEEKIVVCGDVNTAHKKQDLFHPGPNSKYSGFLPQERAWIDDFLGSGFLDSYRYLHGDGKGDFTWWSMRSKTAREKNVGWRLDYIFTSENLTDNLVSAEIHQDIYGSDHCPISITLEF